MFPQREASVVFCILTMLAVWRLNRRYWKEGRAQALTRTCCLVGWTKSQYFPSHKLLLETVKATSLLRQFSGEKMDSRLWCWFPPFLLPKLRLFCTSAFSAEGILTFTCQQLRNSWRRWICYLALMDPSFSQDHKPVQLASWAKIQKSI